MVEFWNDVITQAVVKGLLLGLASTALGWAKSSTPGKLNWRGLVLKLPVGVSIGVAAALKGISIDDAMVWASGVGLVEFLDHITKAIVRRFAPGWLGVSGSERAVREFGTHKRTFKPNTAPYKKRDLMDETTQLNH